MTLLTVAVIVLAVYRATRLIIRDDFPPVARLRDRILAAHPTVDETFYGSEVEDPTATVTTITTLPTLIGRKSRRVEVVTDGDPYSRDENGTLTVGPEGHPIWTPTAGDPWGILVTCAWCASFWISVAASIAVAATAGIGLPVVVWLAVPFALSATTVWLDRHIDP